MSQQCRGRRTSDRCCQAVYRRTLPPRNLSGHLSQIPDSDVAWLVYRPGRLGVLNHEPVGRQILVVGSDSPSTSARSLLEWVRRSVHMVIRAAPQQCMAAEERVPIALETLNDEEEIDLSGRSVGSGQALSSSHWE
jgi:hypothetical protein